jgi:hypothetical protein
MNSGSLDAVAGTLVPRRLLRMGVSVHRGRQVTPVIDRTYSLSETADAIRYLETGTLAERYSSRPEGKEPE